MKVAVITGPTATGKTALGVALAQRCNGEVVSADSMQLYTHMDIGTAKPTAEEMQGIPHHMMGVISPLDNYSVSRYVEDASAVVDDILARGKLPIIVGGTGLYIDALLAGRSFATSESPQLRAELAARYDTVGGAAMLKELVKFDAPCAERLHENDKTRIVRAFEVFELTGIPQSQHDAQTRTQPPRYDAAMLALEFADRADLYARIDKRVDLMVAAGLLQEVQQLLNMGGTAEHTSLQAIGYRELAPVIAGDAAEIAEAIELIKTHSRQYAKRQLTWLRRNDKIRWITWDKAPDIDLGLDISTEFLRSEGYI